LWNIVICGQHDVVLSGPGLRALQLLTLAGTGACRPAERAKFPRYKACGAGMVGQAIRRFQRRRQAVERECHTAELNMLDSDMQFRVTREEPIVWMSMRDKLDQILARNAQRAGVDLREECNVVNVTNGKNGHQRPQRWLVASYAIVCGRALSSIARKVGWRNTRSFPPWVKFR
jgi:flavin-dependent dehydrogenase